MNKEERNKFWGRLRRANDDFLKHNPTIDYTDLSTLRQFHQHMIDQYGVNFDIVSDGIAGSYKICDEAKYTFFLLKYP